MFEVMKPFMPAPPPGVGSTFDWGRPVYVEERLGDAFELEIEEHDTILRIVSGEEAWELFVVNYGPTKVLAASLDADRRQELRRAFVAFFEKSRIGDEIVQSRTFLVIVGRRR